MIPKIIEARPDSSDLSGNNLDSLPESFTKVKSLKIIKLNDNSLTQLPETTGEIDNLTTLEVNNNNLEFFPECISHS